MGWNHQLENSPPQKKDAKHNKQPYSAKQVKTTWASCFGDDICGRKHKEF